MVPDPEDSESVYVMRTTLRRPRGRVYETTSLMLGGGFRPFDWDEDGLPDRVVFDSGVVSVITGSGVISVTGVRTDFSEVDHYSTIHSGAPLEVGDVTGDGLLDLIVATDGWVGVLAGTGPATTSVTVAFDRIGIDGVGWLTPPAIDRSEQDPHLSFQGRTVPSGIAEPVLTYDLSGDGIADIAVYNHASRMSGPYMLLLGQPCNP